MTQALCATRVHIEGHHGSVTALMAEAARQMHLPLKRRLRAEELAGVLRAAGLITVSLSRAELSVRIAQQLISAGFVVEFRPLGERN
jgi:hypothetical protein